MHGLQAGLHVESLLEQVVNLGELNEKLTDEGVQHQQQADYLQNRLQSCQQELSSLEVPDAAMTDSMLHCISANAETQRMHS